jgi:hypothetical protein
MKHDFSKLMKPLSEDAPPAKIGTTLAPKHGMPMKKKPTQKEMLNKMSLKKEGK